MRIVNFLFGWMASTTTFVVFLILLTLLSFAGFVTREIEVRAMQKHIEKMSAQLDRLEEKAGTGTQGQPQKDTLSKKVDDLGKRIDNLANQVQKLSASGQRSGSGKETREPAPVPQAQPQAPQTSSPQTSPPKQSGSKKPPEKKDGWSDFDNW